LALLLANRIGSTNTVTAGSSGHIEYGGTHATCSMSIEASLMLIQREPVSFRRMLRVFARNDALLA
jgi:hypothetical protein